MFTLIRMLIHVMVVLMVFAKPCIEIVNNTSIPAKTEIQTIITEHLDDRIIWMLVYCLVASTSSVMVTVITCIIRSIYR